MPKIILITHQKGGVGKTTLATAIAVNLAHRGLPVHLTTSDPAAHLSETLNGAMDSLAVDRIDPSVETERYRQHDERRGDPEDLEKDPCGKEIHDADVSVVHQREIGLDRG